MQIILSVIILTCSTYLGYQLGNTYRKQYKFYLNLQFYITHLKNNLKNQKNKIVEETEKFIKQNKNNDVNSVLNQFLSCLKLNDTFIIEQKEICLDEQIYLNSFFQSLGKNETNAELNTLDSFMSYFTNLSNEYKAKKDKYSTMYTKLSFLGGCLIVLLII